MNKLFARLLIISLLAIPLINISVTYGDQSKPVTVRSSSNFDAIEIAAETLSTNNSNDDYIYTSGVIKSDLEAWMMGADITLKEESEALYEFSFQYSDDNKDWSDWIHLEFSERDRDLSHLYVDPFALNVKSSYFRYQIYLPHEFEDAIYNIENVEIVTLDPTKEYNNAGFSLLGQSSAKESIDIITREEWGVDESIMFWDDDMEHEKIEQVVIHHTAANDNSPIDPEATIRGIYYFHTVTKGWGDIGYNYLVDQHGNIYEGRKGGLGVVAAHAYGFNYGSVGISVLGNYMEEYPAQESLDAVADIVSYVSFQTGLDLEGKMTQGGTDYDAVVGHRDVGATSCPGDKFYEILPDITEEALKEKYEGTRIFSAEHLDQSSYYVELNKNDTKSITVEYKNTGNAAWLEGLNEVTLVTSGKVGRDSQFAGAHWISTSEVGDMYKYTAMPGGSGVFDLELSGIENNGNFLEKFALKGPDGIIPDSEFSVLINSKGDSEKITKPKNNYGISPARYQAELYNKMKNITVASGQKKKVWIEFTNTGDNIWYNIDPFPMHLGVTNPPDSNSDFYSSTDWLTSNRINLLQTYVSPGEVGHFEFTLDASNVSPGTYTETFSPVLEHLTWLEAPVELSITVT